MNQNWKQRDPVDQLAVGLGCFTGHLSNLKDGIIDVEKFKLYAEHFAGEVYELLPYLRGEKVFPKNPLTSSDSVV